MVLHVFKKKSKRGIATPKPDVNLIRVRFQRAEEMYRQWELQRRKFMKKPLDFEVTTGNIFADLGLDQPEELLARAQLLQQVSTLIKASKLSQQEIATRLGISQPKVSLLLSGKLSAFSTDTLLHYLSLLGCNVRITVKKPRSRVGIFRKRGHIAVA